MVTMKYTVWRGHKHGHQLLGVVMLKITINMYPLVLLDGLWSGLGWLKYQLL